MQFDHQQHCSFIVCFQRSGRRNRRPLDQQWALVAQQLVRLTISPAASYLSCALFSWQHVLMITVPILIISVRLRVRVLSHEHRTNTFLIKNTAQKTINWRENCFRTLILSWKFRKKIIYVRKWKNSCWWKSMDFFMITMWKQNKIWCWYFSQRMFLWKNVQNEQGPTNDKLQFLV